MKKLLITLFLFLPTVVNAAPGFATSKIKFISSGPNYGDKAFVTLENAPSYAVDCIPVRNNQLDYAFDISTAAGKAVLSTALSAHASGKRVHIYGKGTCAVWNGVEDLGWMRILEN